METNPDSVRNRGSALLVRARAILEAAGVDSPALDAELLLAHHANLSAVETQRLQTVVDLAVRLRETVRRLSNACDRQPVSLRSA